MDAEKLLQDWLKCLEWEDEVIADEDDPGSFLVATQLKIAQYFWRLVARASGRTGLVSVGIYAPVIVLDRRRSEVCQLMNAWNARHSNGAFALLEDGRIYFRVCADFEGLSPAGRSVALMSGPAADACLAIHEPLFALALGQKSLVEALAELDSEPGQQAVAPPATQPALH